MGVQVGFRSRNSNNAARTASTQAITEPDLRHDARSCCRLGAAYSVELLAVAHAQISRFGAGEYMAKSGWERSVSPPPARTPQWSGPLRTRDRCHSGSGAADWLAGFLTVSGAALAGCPGHADGLGAGRWQVEAVEVGLWHGPVEADGLVGHG